MRQRIRRSPSSIRTKRYGDRYVLEATSRAETNLVLLLDHDDGERELEYHSERMLELARTRVGDREHEARLRRSVSG